MRQSAPLTAGMHHVHVEDGVENGASLHLGRAPGAENDQLFQQHPLLVVQVARVALILDTQFRSSLFEHRLLESV